MAENKPGDNTPTNTPAQGGTNTQGTNDDAKTNTGTPDPGAFATADTAVAEAAGITEGEVKALRDEAGVNQLPGHEANVLAWEASPGGKAFKDGEKDRVKKYKDEAKAYDEQTSKDGLTEAEAKYQEAVDKARKG